MQGIQSFLQNQWAIVDEDDASRQRRLLTNFLIGIGSLAIVIFLLALIFREEDEAGATFVTWVVPPLILLCVVIYYIAKSNVTLGSSIFIILLVIGTVLSDTPKQVLEGRSLFFMIAPITIASFIIRPNASYYTAGFASLGLYLLAVTEQLTMNYIGAVGFFVFAFVSWLAANAYENTLRELRIINEELDQRVEIRTRELANANERLTELDKLKSKFVSDVSHELRTPISNIALYLEMLEIGNPKKSKQYMNILKEDIKRLTNLVEDTLDLSQLEREEKQKNFSWQNVNEICREVFLANKLRAENDRLEFVFMPKEQLPPIWISRDQIKQVVSNLVANALNYSREGIITIVTSIDDDKKHVCVHVNDTGYGIEPEDLKHIFERFYRGKKASQSTIPGSGLGLAICQEIVELHNGRIEVDSEVGVGSTFSVFLPIMEKNNSEVLRSQL